MIFGCLPLFRDLPFHACFFTQGPPRWPFKGFFPQKSHRHLIYPCIAREIRALSPGGLFDGTHHSSTLGWLSAMGGFFPIQFSGSDPPPSQTKTAFGTIAKFAMILVSLDGHFHLNDAARPPPPMVASKSSARIQKTPSSIAPFPSASRTFTFACFPFNQGMFFFLQKE